LARTQATAASARAAVEVQATAAISAAADAAAARITAEQNGAAANRAAIEATAAAERSAAAATAAATTARAQNVALMITQAFGFLAVLSGLLWKGYTDTRDRRWQKEDTAAHQNVVLNKLGEVKTEATRAYQEANTVNNKIASIGMKMKDGKGLNPEGK